MIPVRFLVQNEDGTPYVTASQPKVFVGYDNEQSLQTTATHAGNGQWVVQIDETRTWCVTWQASGIITGERSGIRVQVIYDTKTAVAENAESIQELSDKVGMLPSIEDVEGVNITVPTPTVTVEPVINPTVLDEAERGLIAAATWGNETRELTSSGASGATIGEIKELGLAEATELERVTDVLPADGEVIAGKSDVEVTVQSPDVTVEPIINPTMLDSAERGAIADATWTRAQRTLTSAGEGGAATIGEIVELGLATSTDVSEAKGAIIQHGDENWRGGSVPDVDEDTLDRLSKQTGSDDLELLALLLLDAASYIASITNLEAEEIPEDLLRRLCVVWFNRAGSEGLSGESFSGVSQSYVDGIPNEIMIEIHRLRKMEW